jgi:hypothetical protein
MCIEQSKTVFSKKKFGNKLFDVRCWSVMCDGCNANSNKFADDAGDAAVLAYKANWTVHFTGRAGQYPGKWLCPACAAKKTAKSKLKKMS